MCYDIKSSLRSQLKRAKHYGNEALIKEIEEKIIKHTDLPIYHRQGHSHPKLLIYTNEQPELPVVSRWGLIPSWTKTAADAVKISKMTLNAKGETIYEKPSFRNAAKRKRCLVYLDGFYEHHHYNGKTYPFYIYPANQEPLIAAGLWEEWVDQSTGEILHTFTIVTTTGNSLLAKIHNNPKLKEPRMPVLLTEANADLWLSTGEDKTITASLIQEGNTQQLNYHTVNRLRGKNYPGNIPEIADKHLYEELDFE